MSLLLLLPLAHAGFAEDLRAVRALPAVVQMTESDACEGPRYTVGPGKGYCHLRLDDAPAGVTHAWVGVGHDGALEALWLVHDWAALGLDGDLMGQVGHLGLPDVGTGFWRLAKGDPEIPFPTGWQWQDYLPAEQRIIDLVVGGEAPTVQVVGYGDPPGHMMFDKAGLRWQLLEEEHPDIHQWARVILATPGAKGGMKSLARQALERRVPPRKPFRGYVRRNLWMTFQQCGDDPGATARVWDDGIDALGSAMSDEARAAWKDHHRSQA